MKLNTNVFAAPFALALLTASFGGAAAPAPVTGVDTAATPPATTRIFVGIANPVDWNLANRPYLGTLSLTTKTISEGAVESVSKRIDGTVNLADYVILDGSEPASELTLLIARDGNVYGKCTLDLAQTVGSPALQVADYQLRIITRSGGQLQAQIGTCSSITNGMDFTPGIPDILETDTVQLDTTNLSLASTVTP